MSQDLSLDLTNAQGSVSQWGVHRSLASVSPEILVLKSRSQKPSPRLTNPDHLEVGSRNLHVYNLQAIHRIMKDRFIAISQSLNSTPTPSISFSGLLPFLGFP